MRETKSSSVKDVYHRDMHGKSCDATTAQICHVLSYSWLTPKSSAFFCPLCLCLVCAFQLIPPRFLSVFNSFSHEWKTHKTFFYFSLTPCLSLFLYSNSSSSPFSSSLSLSLSGKDVRCQPCTCSRLLHLSPFMQEPEQHKRMKTHQSIRIPMLQFRSHMSTWWRRTYTHSQCVWYSHTNTHSHYTDQQFMYDIFSLCLLTAVRQCDRSPCGRGATCQEAPGGYRCLCPPGWTGRTCQLG